MKPVRFVLLIAPLAACGGAKDDAGDGANACDTAVTELPDACPCDAAGIEVGSGAMSFEPMEEGSPLTMVHGPQGGWHMLGSARFSNLLPIVSIHFTIALASDGTVISDNLYRVQMVADTACTGFYPGMYGYLDVTALEEGDRDTPPELLGGAPLELRMEVTDTEGRVATDTLGVIAELDPMDADDGGDTGIE